jgi:hypothetical protein
MKKHQTAGQTTTSTKVKYLLLSYLGQTLKGGPLGISATGRPQNWR